MKFRTEVFIEPSPQKIEIEDHLFSIGSCFASEITARIARGQVRTLNNPFGTIFNPYSINKAIEKISKCVYYSEDDIFNYEGRYLSFDHHTSFDGDSVEQVLGKINKVLEESSVFFKKSKWVIITYGTAFVYEFLPQQCLVANCHKIPQKFFEKRFLSHSEILESIKNTINLINKYAEEGGQILFTVSPVRHTKDGMVENQLSKAKLLTALHEAVAENANCHYLPIYEIMMDDLRDYRFYAEDLIHPNNQGIQYIFEKFGNAYFSEATQSFINENSKIAAALAHRPINPESPLYKEYLEKIKTKIAEQQRKVSYPIFQNY